MNFNVRVSGNLDIVGWLSLLSVAVDKLSNCVVINGIVWIITIKFSFYWWCWICGACGCLWHSPQQEDTYPHPQVSIENILKHLKFQLHFCSFQPEWSTYNLHETIMVEKAHLFLSIYWFACVIIFQCRETTRSKQN